MHTFWGTVDGDQLRLDPEEIPHALKVLRLQPGGALHILDGSGTRFTGVVRRAHKKEVIAEVQETLQDFGAVSGHFHVAIAPTKNLDRMHFFLEKAVEMGIHEITPLVSFHSERRHWNAERAVRVMKAACTQSHKGKLPVLHPLQTLEDVIKQTDTTRVRACMATCLEAPKDSWVEVLSDHPQRPTLLCIGPEGDFSQAEWEQAQKAGFQHVHLGEHRLRTETAGLYAVAAFAQRGH